MSPFAGLSVSQKPPSLLHLPPEILVSICDEIQSNNDLLSFAITNKKFLETSNLATRRKHRHIQIIVQNGGDYSAPFRKLMKILKTPKLGYYVRHIEVDGSFDSFYNLTFQHSSSGINTVALDSADIELLRNAVQNSEISIFEDTEKVVSYILAGLSPQYKYRLASDNQNVPFQELFIALLITVCPRIESLSCLDLGSSSPRRLRQLFNLGPRDPLASSVGGPHNVLARFIEEASNSRERGLYMSRLRKFSVLSDTAIFMNENCYCQHDFKLSLNLVRRLPSIECISFTGVQSPTDWESIRPPPRSANYSSIRMQHCMVHPSILNEIIESSKNLRELVYTSGNRRAVGGYTWGFRPQSLLNRLYLHRSSLEHLELDSEQEDLAIALQGQLSKLFRNAELDENTLITFHKIKNQSLVFRGDSDDENGDGTEAESLEDLEHERLDYEYEWAEELAELRSAAGPDCSSCRPKTAQLRDLDGLKHLGIGICNLYYFALKVAACQDNDEQNDVVSLANCLPRNLKTLRIYGLDDENMAWFRKCSWDTSPIWNAVNKLKHERWEKLPLLSTIEGIDEPLTTRKDSDLIN